MNPLVYGNGSDDPLSFLNEHTNMDANPTMNPNMASMNMNMNMNMNMAGCFPPILPRVGGLIPVPQVIQPQSDDQASKNHKRVLRNRVNAQLSREKKRRHVEELEDRVRVLETKNRHLERRVEDLEKENFFLRSVQQQQPRTAPQLEVLERFSPSSVGSSPSSSSPSSVSLSTSQTSYSSLSSSSPPSEEDLSSNMLDQLDQLGNLTQRITEIPVILSNQLRDPPSQLGVPGSSHPPTPLGEPSYLESIFEIPQTTQTPLPEQNQAGQVEMMIDPIANHLEQLTHIANELTSNSSPSSFDNGSGSLASVGDPDTEAILESPSLQLTEHIQSLTQILPQISDASGMDEFTQWSELERIQDASQQGISEESTFAQKDQLQANMEELVRLWQYASSQTPLLAFQKALQTFQDLGPQLQKRITDPDPRIQNSQSQFPLPFALAVHSQIYQILQVVVQMLLHFQQQQQQQAAYPRSRLPQASFRSFLSSQPVLAF